MIRAAATSLSLTTKSVLMTVLLAILAVAFSLTANAALGYRVVASRESEVARMLLDASTVKVNSLLTRIARTATRLERNEHLLILSHPDDYSPFELSTAMRSYAAAVSDYLVLHDEIEAVIINTGSESLIVTNVHVSAATSYFSEFRTEAYFRTIEERVLSSGSPGRFLDVAADPAGQNKVLVGIPVAGPEGTTLSVCILAVMGSGFVDLLKYPAEGYVIRDSFGTAVDVAAMEKVLLAPSAGEQSVVSPLLFTDWSLIDVVPTLSLRAYLGYHGVVLWFSLGFVLLSVAAALPLMRAVTAPIRALKGEIDRMVHQNELAEEIATSRARLRLRSALLVLFVATGAIPCLAIGVLSTVVNARLVLQRVGTHFDNHLEVTASQIDFTLQEFETSMFEIALDREFQRAMEAADSGLPTPELSEMFNQALLPVLVDTRRIMGVAILSRDVRLLHSVGSPHMDVRQALAVPDLAPPGRNPGDHLWQWVDSRRTTQQMIRLGMPVVSVSEQAGRYGYILGYLLVDFSIESIMEMVYSVGRYNAAVFLQNSNGETVVSTTPMGGENDWTGTPGADDDNLLVRSANLSRGGMSLTVVLPVDDYRRDVYALLASGIAVTVGLGVLGAVLAYLFYRIVYRKTGQLTRVAQQAGLGDAEARYLANGADEIDELGHSFNEMLDSLHALMDEKVELQLRSRELEMSLLRSQINPHFLYNTLRTVQVLASKRDVRAAEVVKKLIFLFRSSAEASGPAEDTLGNELKRIQYYFDIQQVRFSDKFDVTYEVDPPLLACPVLKMSIQPVVENAIYHGLETMPSGGAVRISAYQGEATLKVVVHDNGMGIQPDRLSAIRAQLDGEAAPERIGIANVHNRIRLHYGSQFGVALASATGLGTTVTISFPFRGRQGGGPVDRPLDS